jgi:hypothetical protein
MSSHTIIDREHKNTCRLHSIVLGEIDAIAHTMGLSAGDPGLGGYETSLARCGCMRCTTFRFLVHAFRRKYQYSDLHEDVQGHIDHVLQYLPRKKNGGMKLPRRPITPKDQFRRLLLEDGKLVWDEETHPWPDDERIHYRRLKQEYIRYITHCAVCGHDLSPFSTHILTTEDKWHPVQLCEDCRSDRKFVQVCMRCDVPYLMNNYRATAAYFDPASGGLLCAWCRESMKYCDRCLGYGERGIKCACRARNVGLHNWDYKPRWVFYLGEKERREFDTLFTGLEIEMAIPTVSLVDTCAHLINKEAFFYAVHDGSIGDHGRQGHMGLELVTMPFSRDHWYEQMQASLAEMLDKIKVNRCRAWDTTTCGFHVHLSRRSFTPARLYKFLSLFMGNISFTLDAAQRKEDEWFEQYSSLRAEGVTKPHLIRKALDRIEPRRRARYVGINTTNKRTVEMRVFKGSLKLATIEKNIELCWAAYDWSQVASLRAPTLGSFLSFVESEKDIYPHLHNFLDARGHYRVGLGDSTPFEGDS